MSFVDMPKDKVEELTGQAKQKAADAAGNDDPHAQEETDQAKSNLTDTGEKIKDAR